MVKKTTYCIFLNEFITKITIINKFKIIKINLYKMKKLINLIVSIKYIDNNVQGIADKTDCIHNVS